MRPLLLTLTLLASLYLMVPASAHAAVVYLDPDVGTYGPGDTFILNVRVDTEGECVNAAEVELSYPKDTLRAVDFGKGRSILSLWIADPILNQDKGLVQFSGGVPGGYCGRVQGDPSLSNILGKVVFTVIGTAKKKAEVAISPSTHVYVSDGLGTQAELKARGATITIASQSVGAPNPWLIEVGEDTTPPDPFTVDVHSNREVFGGKYYIAFQTIDKQSGMDHYEIFEKGGWKKIESPYQLPNQFILDDIQVRAIDKAGNERLGTYEKTAVPIRQFSFYDYLVLIAAVCILLLLSGGVYVWKKKE